MVDLDEIMGVDLRAVATDSGSVTVRVQRLIDGAPEAPDDPASDIARHTVPGKFLRDSGYTHPLPEHFLPPDESYCILVEVNDG